MFFNWWSCFYSKLLKRVPAETENISVADSFMRNIILSLTFHSRLILFNVFLGGEREEMDYEAGGQDFSHFNSQGLRFLSFLCDRQVLRFYDIYLRIN